MEGEPLVAVEVTPLFPEREVRVELPGRAVHFLPAKGTVPAFGWRRAVKAPASCAPSR